MIKKCSIQKYAGSILEQINSITWLKCAWSENTQMENLVTKTRIFHSIPSVFYKKKFNLTYFGFSHIGSLAMEIKMIKKLKMKIPYLFLELLLSFFKWASVAYIFMSHKLWLIFRVLAILIEMGRGFGISYEVKK